MSAHATRRGFRLEHHRLVTPLLSPGVPPLRFWHLSDLHLRRLTARHERLLETMAEREADFVFVTGDFLTPGRGAWQALERLFTRLRARSGVFACRGNWEVQFGPRPSVLKKRLSACGVELLINESRVIETDSGRIRIAGVDDLGRGRPDFRATFRSFQRADFHIVLAHAPLAAEFVSVRDDVQLVLSGHTHGGQIRIPALWRMLLPPLRAGYVSGLYGTAWGHVYVSRGFGTVGLPLRFRCPAEAAFFELRGAGEGG
ncbi:MAG: metallophosphoesterase [Planctomycetes bacterium]|nr:metallophosphoesterase [Planctomycetota bacterium]